MGRGNQDKRRFQAAHSGTRSCRTTRGARFPCTCKKNTRRTTATASCRRFRMSRPGRPRPSGAAGTARRGRDTRSRPTASRSNLRAGSSPRSVASIRTTFRASSVDMEPVQKEHTTKQQALRAKWELAVCKTLAASMQRNYLCRESKAWRDALQLLVAATRPRHRRDSTQRALRSLRTPRQSTLSCAAA